MFGLLKDAFKDFNEDDAPVRAAALAYYTVFALPPLLILLILVAGVVWDTQDVERALQGQFASLVGPEGGRAIQEMIARADRPGTGGIVTSLLGIGALLFGATGAFLQLQNALNKAWEVKPDPEKGGIKQFISKRATSLGLILGVAFLLIVSLALSALITLVGESITAIPEAVLHGANFVVSFAVMTLLFAAIFKILPDADISWRQVWLGAAVTSVLFVLGKFAIGLYLGRSSPGDAFGAASALAVILIWVYYAGMIVLFGAEFTQAYSRRHGWSAEPENGAKRTARASAETKAAESLQSERKGGYQMKKSWENDRAERIFGNGTGTGNGGPRQYEEVSIGDLFRNLGRDAGHLVQQEINLAKTELMETAQRVGGAASKIAVAALIGLAGVMSLTAFMVVALGAAMDNYWLSALIVGVVLLAVAGITARAAINAMRERPLGVPETTETLKEDAQWARNEVQELKRELTA